MKKVTIREAAEELQRLLRQRHAALIAVGIGEDDGRPNIIVYTRKANSKELESLRNGWRGFPVRIEKTGAPRLLSAAILPDNSECLPEQAEAASAPVSFETPFGWSRRRRATY